METKDFLKQLIADLSKPIPHQWRVQSFSKNKPVATVIGYIDARDCVDALNTYAVYGWHREHYVVDGKVYCKVGIIMPDGSIQWRSDCGVESQGDAVKGQSSDSFKRACVNFGIGRFLYDLPVEYLTTNAKKEANTYPYCIDETGKQIWDITKYINERKSQPSSQPDKKNLLVNVPKTLTIDELTELQDSLALLNDRPEFVKYYNQLSPEMQKDPGALELFKMKKESFEKQKV